MAGGNTVTPQFESLPAGLEIEQAAQSFSQVAVHETQQTVEGFRHVRQDGTVEYAESVSQAREKCPILGKMSVEEAKVMLELSVMTAEFMKKEAQPKPDHEIKKTEQPKQAVAEKVVSRNFDTQIAENERQPVTADATADVATVAPIIAPRPTLVNVEKSVQYDQLFVSEAILQQQVIQQESMASPAIAAQEMTVHVAQHEVEKAIAVPRASETMQHIVADAETVVAVPIIEYLAPNSEVTNVSYEAVAAFDLSLETSDYIELYAQATAAEVASIRVEQSHPEPQGEASIAEISAEDESPEDFIAVLQVAAAELPQSVLPALITERLAAELEPDQKAIVEPIVEALQEIMQTIEQADEPKVTPELIAELENHLEELCLALNIEPNKAEIKQLVAALLAQATTIHDQTIDLASDLEKDGMHSAKSFPKIANSLRQFATTRSQSVGTLVLFYMRIPQLQKL